MSNFIEKVFSDSPTLRVMRREFRRIFSRKALYSLMIIMPLIIFFMMFYIYRDRVIIDMPVGVVDNDDSELSRMIVRSIESTRSLKITGHYSSVDEIREGMRKGNIQGAFYIPEDLEKDIKRGKSGTIVVYKNSSNIIIGNLILKDASTIVQTISAGIVMKRLQAGGLSADQALVMANPIRIESNSLFNPGYNYANFLPPGIVMVLLQMLIMIMAVVAINDEINEKTIHDLFETAGGKVHAVLFGKMLAHTAIHIATGMGVLGLLFPLFKVPFNGSMLLAVPFMIYFIIAGFLPGFVVSCMFNNRFIATDFAAFYNSPAFLFSGYTYPLWAMPGVHNWYAQILPFTHFLSGFMKIYQYNAPAVSLLPELGALSIFIAVSLIAAPLLLKYRIKPMAYGTDEESRVQI